GGGGRRHPPRAPPSPGGGSFVRPPGGRFARPPWRGVATKREDNFPTRRPRHDAELEHDHDDFESFVVPLPEIADPTSFATRIAIAAADASVLRVKGFAAVAGKPMRLLVQAVGPRVSHHYDRAWAAAEKRQGQLVIIGLKGLDREGLRRALLG